MSDGSSLRNEFKSAAQDVVTSGIYNFMPWGDHPLGSRDHIVRTVSELLNPTTGAWMNNGRDTNVSHVPSTCLRFVDFSSGNHQLLRASSNSDGDQARRIFDTEFDWKSPPQQVPISSLSPTSTCVLRGITFLLCSPHLLTTRYYITVVLCT